MNAWIVIPVFDEAPTVGPVVAAARRHGPVLVVDDGSTDESGAIARAAGAEVVRHGRRLGKGQALRSGLATVRRRGASHMVTLDGDGQHAVGDLPRLLEAARGAPRAIIVGSRVGGDGRSGLPRGRLNAIRVAGFFVSWATGLRVEDTQSGFRVYPVTVFDEIRVRRGGFTLETEVLVAAAERGIAVAQVPITVIPRAGRRSRFRPFFDGAAIGLYLAGPVARRWSLEARAAAREVRALFDARRRHARHQAMLQGGSPYVGSPVWGAMVGGVAVQRAAVRLARWWVHPRRRRAAVVAGATLATPLLLACAVLETIGGRRMPDVSTKVVRRFYSQRRLDVPEDAAAGETIAARKDEAAAAPRPGLP